MSEYVNIKQFGIHGTMRRLHFVNVSKIITRFISTLKQWHANTFLPSWCSVNTHSTVYTSNTEKKVEK